MSVELARRIVLADDHTALDTVLTGPLLLRSAKGMLMGPASALQGDGWPQGKPGNAVVIGLKTFTARIIAYIACQVRFNLSSQSQWNKLDGHFDYQVFFWHLVSLFNDKNNKAFAARTIALYNRPLSGSHSLSVLRHDSSPAPASFPCRR
ncbi:hypothetical protein DFH09DRAFT_47527 [Mycena vulgaris]|nr:hypothetical protein DFH09DRAFT_47527 [Mycena vulgaris]